jgi:uncharacterized protein
VQFEWDNKKNIKNKRKHGISFELASLIFHDSCLISMPDHRHNEERWQSIGQIDGVIIYVAHTIGEDENAEEIIRIISARKATPSEERRYYINR